MVSVDIDTICKKGYCIGCGLCVAELGQDKLRMVESEEGFLVPKEINSEELAFDRELCPGITVRQPLKKQGDARIYGSYKTLKVGFSTDNQIRLRASSGGVITALLCYLLDKALIDGVLHIGKDESTPLRSKAFFSQKKSDVINRSGSRYAPAALLVELKRTLESYQKIAIVGKPCDIVAVKNYLSKNTQFEAKVVVLISFMCMGVPSYRGTYSLVKNLGCDLEDVKDFWYRGNGWPGKATVVDRSGSEHSCSYEESWGKTLSPMLNSRCKICPDGYGEFADISCGDAWYIRGNTPDFREREGRSLIFIRTERGDEVYKGAVSFGYVRAEDYAIASLQTIQSSQYYRKKVFVSRVAALKFLGDHLLHFDGFDTFFLLREAGLKEIIKNFFGMLKRQLLKKSKRSE